MDVSRPLRRNRHNAMIGGVCAGIADYLGMDITLVRVLYVLISLMTILPGPLTYIVMWIIIPEREYY